ncbi:Fms-interacting protein-domain-containing protein [Cladochytrium replicatum]|nr:Fms-interacting protein-domain-containing protein [Cladochytrium replicatum]
MDWVKVFANLRETVSTLVSRAEQGSFSEATHEEGNVPASFNNAATALFLELTEVNRSLHLHSKAVKQETHDAKQTIDRAQLECKSKLRKTLPSERLKSLTSSSKLSSTCLKTIYQDIDRMPEEEFIQQALPEYIAAATDERNMLLSQEEKELETQTTQLATEMKEKAAELESIDKELEQLLKYTVPLQESLKLPVTAQHTTIELAALLPRPLFVLYQTAYGFSTAFEGATSVLIEGDQVAALQYLEQRAEAKEDDDQMETDAGDDEKEEHQSHGHHKVTDETFVRHPLKLVISIPGTASSELLEPIEFVRPAFLLSALFPSDFGLTNPNPLNKHFRRSHGAIDRSFTTGKGTYLAHGIELVRARHAALKELGAALCELEIRIKLVINCGRIWSDLSGKVEQNYGCGMSYEVSIAVSPAYPDDVSRFQIVVSTGIRVESMEKRLENPLQIIA